MDENQVGKKRRARRTGKEVQQNHFPEVNTAFELASDRQKALNVSLVS